MGTDYNACRDLPLHVPCPAGPRRIGCPEACINAVAQAVADGTDQGGTKKVIQAQPACQDWFTTAYDTLTEHEFDAVTNVMLHVSRKMRGLGGNPMSVSEASAAGLARAQERPLWSNKGFEAVWTACQAKTCDAETKLIDSKSSKATKSDELLALLAESERNQVNSQSWQCW